MPQNTSSQLKSRRLCVLGLLVLAVPALIGAHEILRWRPPVGAGPFYPEDGDTLRKTVERYITEAEVPESKGRLVACIVPNGPYGLSGDVAGHAFKHIEPGQYDRVIILSPSHFAHFRGCSIASVQAYQTPLGDAILDGPAIRKLTWSTLFEARSLRYDEVPQRSPIHEKEFGIEVILPFLQVQLRQFEIVPVVVGDFVSYSGGIDEHGVDKVVENLRKIMDDRTLLVVSTNLTHHGNMFSYHPFRDNITGQVRKLDLEAISLIMARDIKGFHDYCDRTRNTIYGRIPIAILLKLLPPNAVARLLDHQVSSEKTGDESMAVGYATIVFHDPSQPPPTPRPLLRPATAEPPAAVVPAPGEKADAAPAQGGQDSAGASGNAP